VGHKLLALAGVRRPDRPAIDRLAESQPAIAKEVGWKKGGEVDMDRLVGWINRIYADKGCVDNRGSKGPAGAAGQQAPEEDEDELAQPELDGKGPQRDARKLKDLKVFLPSTRKRLEGLRKTLTEEATKDPEKMSRIIRGFCMGQALGRGPRREQGRQNKRLFRGLPRPNRSQHHSPPEGITRDYRGGHLVCRELNTWTRRHPLPLLQSLL
jgi:hypothetical protein